MTVQREAVIARNEATKQSRAAIRPDTIESRGSWIVALTALGIYSVSFGAPVITVVALKTIATDLGSPRSVPALSFSLAWFGAAVGGVGLGWLADRIGIRWVVVGGAFSIAAGLILSSLGNATALLVGHGVFIGLLGNGGINAPVYVYVSRWFDKRRGSAIVLISSGMYLAGVIWPTPFERAIAAIG
jgi:MFS family permease